VVLAVGAVVKQRKCLGGAGNTPFRSPSQGNAGGNASSTAKLWRWWWWWSQMLLAATVLWRIQTTVLVAQENQTQLLE
jgi:hypothetical protein